MINVAIVGITGYTGMELMRLLIHHPEVEITAVTSGSQAGKHIVEIYPHVNSLLDLVITDTEEFDPDTVDVIFLGLPHGISMAFVEKHGLESARIIDLSGDFRLSSADLYNQWYPHPHSFPEGIPHAVYGLPELFRDDIRDAVLVANPGCYPTSTLLPLVPLIREEIIDPAHVFVDSKSGMSGAGATPKPNTHYPNAAENFMAYGLKNHRHTPEIQDITRRYCGMEAIVQFTPHLLPVSRGILTTLYGLLITDLNENLLREVYQNYYGNEPFIRLVDSPPQLHQVRGSNFCDIYTTIDERTGHLIAVSCIDNMVKGAAGQAIQNMNIMMGLEETLGLDMVPFTP